MLGKGLESLIPDKYSPVIEPAPAPAPLARPASAPDSGEAVFHIEVDRIRPNPHQPRKSFDDGALAELASSVREFGVIQPLIVTKVEHDMAYGTAIEYQLIAGERRLRAAKLAGLPTVPAIVRRAPEEREKFEMAIVENVQRADLNPIDAARSYAKLQEQFGMTQREVAVRMGKSREVIANSLRLLNLPTDVQDALAAGKLSESQGRVLLAVADPAKQRELFMQVTTNNVSVREMKNTAARMNLPEPANGIPYATTVSAPAAGFVATPAPLAPETPFIRFGEESEYEKLARELQAALHVPVAIERRGERNKITIDIASEGELRALIGRLRAEG